MKPRASSLRAWLTTAGLLTLVVGVLSDLGGAVATWKSFISWLNEKLRLPPDSSLIQNELWLLPSLLLLVTALVALLRWAVELAETTRDVKRSSVRRTTIADDPVRNRYLSYLSADLENRVRSSIHHARFLDLGLTETWGATVPWHYQYWDPEAGQEVFGSFDEAFDRFGRRILLLGSPGSGKSTTLLQTAMRLLKEASKDPAAPIPVLLNLSSFGNQPRTRLPWRQVVASPEPVTEKDASEDPSFDLWLAEQLARLPVRGLGEVSPRWIEDGRIALLLDGLDEVEEARAERLIRTLNGSFLRRYPDLPTIICSRVIEYRRLTADPVMRLRLDRAVTLLPLDRDQINAYLEAADATALPDILLGDQGLYELAQTPLTLSMMTLAYGGLAPTAIPPNLPLVERRRHLFDTYIERMLQRAARREAGKPFDLDCGKDESTRYSLEQVNRYLGWLAVRLSERMQTSFAPRDLLSLLDKEPVIASKSFWTEARLAMFLYVSLFSVSLSCLLLAGPTVRLAWVGLAGPAVCMLPILTIDEDSRLVSYLFLSLISSIVILLISLGFYFLVSALASLLPGAVPWAVTGTLVASWFAVESLWDDKEFLKRMCCSLSVIVWAAGGLMMIFLHRLADWYWVLPLGACLGLFGGCLGMLKRNTIRAYLQLGSIFLIAIGGIVCIGQLGARFLGPPIPIWIAILATVAIGVYGKANPDKVEVLPEIMLGTMLGMLLHGATGAVLGAAFLPLAVLPFKRIMRPFATTYLFQPCLLAVLAVRRRAPWRFRRFLVEATETLLLKQAGGDYEFVHPLLRDHFALRDLVPHLYDERQKARLDVLQRLGSQGESSFDILLDLTNHQDPKVRVGAVLGLGNLPTPMVAPLLVSLLAKDQEPAVHRQVLERLRKLPWEEIGGAIEAAFQNDDPSVRLAALEAAAASDSSLESHGFLDRAIADTDPRVFRAALLSYDRSLYISPDIRTPGLSLRPYLTDPSAEIRKAAAVVAGKFKGRESLSLLVEACRDPDSEVRGVAAEALKKFDSAEAVQALISALKDCMPIVRKASAKSLGNFDNAEVVPALIDALRDRMPIVRAASAEALGHIRVQYSRKTQLPRPDWWLAVEEDLARSLLDDEPKVRQSAAFALSPSVEPETERALIQALVDSENQFAVISTLSRLPRPSDLDPVPSLELAPLLTWLRRADWKSMSEDAAKVLGRYRPTAFQPILLSWLRGRHSQLRTAAVTALGEMQVKEAIPDLLKLAAPSSWWHLRHRYVSWLGLGPVDDPRVLAIEALGKIQDQEAVPILGEILNQKATRQNRDLRMAAFDALKSIGGPEAKSFVDSTEFVWDWSLLKAEVKL